MIECPYCRNAITEDTPRCPACQLDLHSAKTIMGPVPKLNPYGVTDFAGCLDPAEARSIAKVIQNFRTRFPHSNLAVVLKPFAPTFPLGTHLFWLFNTSGLSPEERKRGTNRDVLIGIDTGRKQAGLTIGYGLEPFLNQAALDRVLASGVPFLKEGDYLSGVTEIIKGMTSLMEETWRELQEVLGGDPVLAAKSSPQDY